MKARYFILPRTLQALLGHSITLRIFNLYRRLRVGIICFLTIVTQPNRGQRLVDRNPGAQSPEVLGFILSSPARLLSSFCLESSQ